MACPYGKTKDGFETQIGVNHLGWIINLVNSYFNFHFSFSILKGHFLLTNLLLDILKRSAPSRIINVSSLAHKNGRIRWVDLNWEKEYSAVAAYSQSKLANVLFTIELANLLKGSNVTTVSLHPGVVNTELVRNLHGCLGCLAKICLPCVLCCWKTPTEGAETTIFCATSSDKPNLAGSYFSDSRVEHLSVKASNAEDAARLWKLSAEFVKL